MDGSYIEARSKISSGLALDTPDGSASGNSIGSEVVSVLFRCLETSGRGGAGKMPCCKNSSFIGFPEVLAMLSYGWEWASEELSLRYSSRFSCAEVGGRMSGVRLLMLLLFIKFFSRLLVDSDASLFE